MKKVLILLLIIILCGCSKNVTTTITTSNHNFSYGDEIYLYDLIKITNGILTDENYLIDTMKLGKKTITINYLNYNGKPKISKVTINIEDKISPVILSSDSINIEKGDTTPLVNYILCGDNYDRNLICNVEGNYDINTIGEYNLKFSATDSNNNYTEKKVKLIVEDEIIYNYDEEYYYFKDLIKKYKTNNTLVGIDVSSWQGNINWNKVKADGVEFAMIRIGYGHNDEGKIIIDDNFKNNLKKAKEVGIKVGLYFYSYATTIKEAKEQALWIVNILQGEKLDLPIAFDFEDWSSFSNYHINFVDLNKVAKTFFETLKNNNYEVMIYGSKNYLTSIWNLNNLTWLAHYTNKTTYNKPYYIWQLSNTGKVNGIDSHVDLNILYQK